MSFNAEFMAEIFVSRTRTVSTKKNVSYDFLTVEHVMPILSLIEA